MAVHRYKVMYVISNKSQLTWSLQNQLQDFGCTYPKCLCFIGYVCVWTENFMCLPISVIFILGPWISQNDPLISAQRFKVALSFQCWKQHCWFAVFISRPVPLWGFHSLHNCSLFSELIICSCNQSWYVGASLFVRSFGLSSLRSWSSRCLIFIECFSLSLNSSPLTWVWIGTSMLTLCGRWVLAVSLLHSFFVPAHF